MQNYARAPRGININQSHDPNYKIKKKAEAILKAFKQIPTEGG